MLSKTGHLATAQNIAWSDKLQISAEAYSRVSIWCQQHESMDLIMFVTTVQAGGVLL